jgi:hypothetical protein
MARGKGRGGARTRSGRKRKDGARHPCGRLIYPKTDLCACGQPKARVARTCRACYWLPRAKRPILCACGQPKARGSRRCLACYWIAETERRRSIAESKHGRTCQGCGVPFVAKKDSGSGRVRTYSRFHSKACRRRWFKVRREARHAALAEARRQRLCRHCGHPMGVLGSTWVHASCLSAYKKAAYRKRYVCRGEKGVQRACLWCEAPFITIHALQRLCSRRCRVRWRRVSQKHGLSRSTTTPEMIRCRRLLNDAYFALQCAYTATSNDGGTSEVENHDRP